MNVLYIIVQTIIMILIAPMVSGIIKKVKALTQKRKGSPVLQQYFDLYKLFLKRPVAADTCSWIFTATPYIVFASSLAAALLVPATAKIKTGCLPGDAVALVSVLALGRFFMILSGLDAASTFGGMGSSRESMISALIEPSILVSLLTLGLIAGSTSADKIMLMNGEHVVFHTELIMLFLAILLVIIAETSRIPVDDPETHLELTMVHEAMLLEYSGRHLALMEYGQILKQLVFITLLVNIFIPHDQFIAMSGILSLFISLAVYTAKVIFASVLIGFIETGTVKFRFFSIPNLAALSFILSFLGFLQYFILGR